MKGRMYDPKVGRFLTTDPIVPEPLSAQSWNPYSYVRNNPLNRVDPSGFEDVSPPGGFQPGVWYGDVCAEPGCDEPPPPPKKVERTQEAVTVDAATRPTDVSTTGTAAKEGAQPVTAAPRDWKAHPAAQIAGGILASVYNFVKSNGEAATGMLIDPEGVARRMQMTALQAAITEYHRDGLIGAGVAALNTVNPFYSLAVTAVDTKTAADKGDYWGAASGATTLGLAVASVLIGGESGAAKGVVPGEAGAYGGLKARGVVGDGLEAHHMPQAALEFASRDEGGALVLEKGEHTQTRTYGARGAATRSADAGQAFRSVLARDIRDVRRIVGPKYDGGIRGLLQYYYENFPELINK
jgi:hypothetical protein